MLTIFNRRPYKRTRNCTGAIEKRTGDGSYTRVDTDRRYFDRRKSEGLCLLLPIDILYRLTLVEILEIANKPSLKAVVVVIHY